MEMSDKIRILRDKHGLTLEQVGNAVGVGKSTVRKWENGDIKNMRRDKIASLAAVLQTTPAYLMGWDEEMPRPLPSNIKPLKKVHYVPRIGRIACGTPILAEQNIQGYVLLPDNVKADFVLDCAGNSMIDASIDDGDTVFIRQQPEVENGEIAAVLVGEEATLKRVYRKDGILTLMPANSDYAPLVYTGEGLEEIRILGKATAVLKML